ncbi:zinc-finger domain-containing protein [Shewanella algae]|uniref:zinc-finger domain-containing protein n=1 Tax=Shewanella algae TaxID=38313 RepID=UPI00313B1AE2
MQTYGRSSLEIAEDNLLELVIPVHNVSKQDAQRLCIQRREIGKQFREAGEQLLDNWQGTPEQIASANRLQLARSLQIMKS